MSPSKSRAYQTRHSGARRSDDFPQPKKVMTENLRNSNGVTSYSATAESSVRQSGTGVATVLLRRVLLSGEKVCPGPGNSVYGAQQQCTNTPSVSIWSGTFARTAINGRPGTKHHWPNSQPKKRGDIDDRPSCHRSLSVTRNHQVWCFVAMPLYRNSYFVNRHK